MAVEAQAKLAIHMKLSGPEVTAALRATHLIYKCITIALATIRYFCVTDRHDITNN